MNDNKILQQISAIFSIFMVMFYIGVGSFLIFFYEQSFFARQSLIDKTTRIIIGSAFLIYGTYRIFKTFFQIKELFFDTEIDDEE